MATRYDPYAPRCLGFLYLAGAWIWLKSYLNTADSLWMADIQWFPHLVCLPVPTYTWATQHASVMPARARRTNPLSYDPERYKARNAIEDTKP